MKSYNFSNNMSFIDNKELRELDFDELIKNYPEPHDETSKKYVSKFFSIDNENIILGAGTTQLFYLLAQILRETIATKTTNSEKSIDN